MQKLYKTSFQAVQLDPIHLGLGSTLSCIGCQTVQLDLSHLGLGSTLSCIGCQTVQLNPSHLGLRSTLSCIGCQTVQLDLSHLGLRSTLSCIGCQTVQLDPNPVQYPSACVYTLICLQRGALLCYKSEASRCGLKFANLLPVSKVLHSQ